MKTHELKTVQPYFDEVWNMNKNFECRKNDRNFKQHDELVLKEYDPESKTYSGREIYAVIRYILTDDFEGVSKGYCILSLKRINCYHREI